MDSSNNGNEKIPTSSRIVMSNELTVKDEKHTTSSKVNNQRSFRERKDLGQ